MVTLSASSRGTPASLVQRPTALALYLSASGMSLSIRSCTDEIELIIFWFLPTWRPASMASMFMVSSDSGRSVTSSIVSTIHCMSSGPFLVAGPRFMSIASGPPSSCSVTMSWMGFLSLATMASLIFVVMTLTFSATMYISSPPCCLYLLLLKPTPSAAASETRPVRLRLAVRQGLQSFYCHHPVRPCPLPGRPVSSRGLPALQHLACTV